MFKQIEIGWHDDDYVIPADKVLGAVAAVEEVITVQKLMRISNEDELPLSHVAMAYANLLRYAGAKVTDDEVYQGMFADPQAQELVGLALIGLFEMVAPPKQGKKRAPARKRTSRSARSKSSKATTKR